MPRVRALLRDFGVVEVRVGPAVTALCLVVLNAMVVLAEGTEGSEGSRDRYLAWGIGAVGNGQVGFEEVFRSVIRVTRSVQYRTAFYKHELSDGRPARDASSPTGYRLKRGKAGTWTALEFSSQVGAGLLLAREPGHGSSDVGVVLTAAHVVVSPDTVRTTLFDSAGRPTDIPDRVAIKVDERIFVKGWGGTQAEAAVRRVDREEDLALLSVAVPSGVEDFRPFGDRMGAGEDLRWGTLVYLAGFPNMQLQVAGGLVNPGSRPDQFVVSAAVGPGYSGGPVMAVRGGANRFEFVGVCVSMPSRSVRFLSPEGEVEPGAQATDEVLAQTTVRKVDLPEYGTAQVVGIGAIRKFVVGSLGVFAEQGIDVASRPELRAWGFTASSPTSVRSVEPPQDSESAPPGGESVQPPMAMPKGATGGPNAPQIDR